ncbi:MAG: glycosyltransferase [Bacteroidales bacterium]|nr:glycosyltransferase [Bacteroidales bacterium]
MTIPGKRNNTAILSVTNDLATDQRINKVATSLIKTGLVPIVVGRIIKPEHNLAGRNYTTKRFKLLFNKGPLFYANYNIRLFIFLLFSNARILISNDLDTLPANFLAYIIKKALGNKNIKLVYDSHELFIEVPELNNRKMVKKTWFLIEKFILPKLKNTYTVCEPIAEYYNEKYGINMQVIRNMPLSNMPDSINEDLNLELPSDKKIILYQGALNIGRGIEHVINVMNKINDAIFVIAGSGGIEEELHRQVTLQKVEKKVIFVGKLPLEKLNQLTQKANIGLVLQEDISLSYHFVLPNRLFDFIRAGVPVLASSLPEIKKIVENEDIGLLTDSFEPETLLRKIEKLIYDNDLILHFKKNIEACKSKYYWENEEYKLFNIYQNLL